MLDVYPNLCYAQDMTREKPERPHETRISIRFPDDVLAGMRKLMREDERSFNGEIIVALREFIARRDQLTEKRPS